MPRTPGRYGFSRVVWDHEIAGSGDEDDSTAQGASTSKDVSMDVDSCYIPPRKPTFSTHSSPTPPLSEVEAETEKAREIIRGIKLSGITIDPLDDGQVCYQGGNRFRILNTNWRVEAELRRAMSIREIVGTYSGNDATRPDQLASPSGVITTSPTRISSKKSSSTGKKHGSSFSALSVSLARKRKPITSTQLSGVSTRTLRPKEQGETPEEILVHNGEEFPVAATTILDGQEVLECPTEGCGSHFSRLYDYFRHMRTVHKRTSLACRQCGHSFSRSDSLNRHTKTVHSAIRDGNSTSPPECP